MLVWTNELDSKLIEQFKTDNKSKVKDFKNHLNLQKLTKKEIRARLEFLKLKRKGTKSEQDWEDFSSSYDVKQSEPSALVDQQDKADEKDEETIKDDTEPTRLADDSKINMIKSSLVGSQKFAKPQFSDQTIKTNGFVKEMASQEVKDFKSFKFEDKSLPGNGNVRTLMKTLTKSSITPSKKRQVKKIVSKFETVDGKSSKSKSMTPSLQAAVVSGSTRRGKSLLLSAVNNGKENASASEFKHVSHDTPSIKAAVAAKRTKTFKPVGVSDKKKDLLSSPSILAAKGAKMNVGVDLMTAPTEKSLMWTPSRKAAQKAERVTKSMLDFEEILRNGSKAGKNAALPEDLEVPEKVEQVAPIPADEPKDNQDLSSSTRRSPRHKRVMEIPRSNLKTLPLLSSPLRNSIKFESPEGSPNDAITPLASKSTLDFKAIVTNDFSLAERGTPRKRKREDEDDNAQEDEFMAVEKKSKFVDHVAPIDELQGRNSFLSRGMYQLARNLVFGAGY